MALTARAPCVAMVDAAVLTAAPAVALALSTAASCFFMKGEMKLL